MNEFSLNRTDGRERLQQLINEAEQERFARKFSHKQAGRKPFTQLKTLMVKVLSTLTR